MTSHVAPYSIDDKDLDDATLWALMDSASAAASLSSKPRKPLPIKHSAHQSPTTPVSYHSPPALAFSAKCNKRAHYSPRPDLDSGVLRDGEVLQEPVDSDYRPPPPPPQKIARYCGYGYGASETSPLSLVRSAQRTPMRSSPEAYLSPEISKSAMSSPGYCVQSEEKEVMKHCLNGKFPTVSLFKEYQNAAMAILEKTDYTMISGNPFIKKSGWRKISFYFNLSYEIRDKTIEFDENRNVQRAEFVVRAYMQGGRFSDGWGSCERREKRFSKPNHDIPSTAETRAKNKACQDLLGIGEYRSGASRAP
ncbi:hypothetical protein BT93_K0438 [Corymbia citriodora subsp. variegata]|nr:hypothetical protein BT93_K0438 [Corymbia citriodora subsp. variegata]